MEMKRFQYSLIDFLFSFPRFFFRCFCRILATCVPPYAEDGHSAVNTGTQRIVFGSESLTLRVPIKTKCAAENELWASFATFFNDLEMKLCGRCVGWWFAVVIMMRAQQTRKRRCGSPMISNVEAHPEKLLKMLARETCGCDRCGFTRQTRDRMMETCVHHAPKNV